MLGASLLKVVKFGAVFTGHEVAVLLVGCITAFVVSLFIIKFLMNFVKTHDFKVFGWYRINVEQKHGSLQQCVLLIL